VGTSWVGCLGLLSLLLLSAPALAQEVEMSRGAVCDTHKQAERLASLMAEDAEIALQTVNAEERDATACEYLTMAFVRGPRVGLVRTNGLTMEVVEVFVVGVLTATGLQPAEPGVHFSGSRSLRCELGGINVGLGKRIGNTGRARGSSPIFDARASWR
jgi:hypothetical protein